MLITEEQFQAFLHCETKAYLKSIGTVAPPQEYAEWRRRTEADYEQQCLAQLHAGVRAEECFPSTPSPNELKARKYRLVTGAVVQAQEFAARIQALERVDIAKHIKLSHYIPIRFVPNEKITSFDKLLLAYDGLALSAATGKKPPSGKIIHGSKQTVMKVNLPDWMDKAKATIGKMVAKQTGAAPPLILNRHCAECEFKVRCRQIAVEKDDLSLLSGMTEKERKQQHSKGIFTVTQLSYTYRPRRRPKRLASKPDNYSHALRALAIRENKIHIAGSPKLNITGTPVYLDVEGVPDRDFYYLIGLRVKDGDSYIQHSFWANDASEEKEIWACFLRALAQIENPQLVHYGSYETTFLKQMKQRYGNGGEGAIDLDQLIKDAVNVLTIIYAQIYFPTYSNGLKEIGTLIGASWTSPNASGLQSLVWRHDWEKTQDNRYREILITYNQDDCIALVYLKDKLLEIQESADTLAEVDFAHRPKRMATKLGEHIHNHLETVLKFSQSNYDKRKIKFRKFEDEKTDSSEEKKRFTKKGYQGQRKVRPKAQKTIQVPPATTCPKHNRLLCPTDRVSKRLIIDLVPSKRGIKKTITEYVGFQGYCTKCHRHLIPPELTKYGKHQLYGHGFQAWAIYQRVALKMTYGGIAEAGAEQFGEKGLGTIVAPFIQNLSAYYNETENIITRQLLNSPFIHADETPINIRGATQYVWTFTNDKHVILKLSKTREALVAHEFLASYNGVLISDFYPGYDSIGCKQQKCWVHLIRDLNNDLWGSPFDIEYEAFVSEIRGLIIPIMEAVQKYGLKKRNLNKFTKEVERFYQRDITNKKYKSELALKYQKRFTRYRESLFTFLIQDGIPWHNNTAERALRHIAKQREISGNLHESVTPDYLRLLEIRQTCRFQGKSFFKFLFSKEKNIDQFKRPAIAEKRR
jgi:predicted RecB family nuclease